MAKRESSIIDYAPGGTVWRANIEAAYPWRYPSDESEESE